MTDVKIQHDVKIPKIIMQTWKTKDVPDHWKSSPKAIKKYMPDWEYILMTDEDNRNFISKHFPDFLDTYDNFEYNIMRADAIRYGFLYVMGGIYMDLDIQLIKPIDELFTEDKEVYLVPSSNISNYYTNAFMASKPGANIWLRCMKEMTKPYRFWQIGKHLKVMATTGPMMLTRAIKPIKKQLSHKDLPGDLIITCTICDAKPCDRKHGYARTLQGSSWVEQDTQFFIFCTCNWKAITAVIIILIVIIIIMMRYRREIK